MFKNANIRAFACLAALGGIGLGYAGARALLGLAPGAEDNFFDWKGPRQEGVVVGSDRINLPVKYYRDDSFAGFFSAAVEPVQALLPSPELYPVTLPDGRAVVAIFAFNYLETDIGPYGEVAVTIPCTYGQKGPPLLPLALEARYPGFGAFVAHLPVTSRFTRDAGRVVWGLAKFVGDMAFERHPAYQRVRLSEEGRHILTLTVRQQGIPLKDNRPLVIYSVLDKRLLKTVVPCRAVYQLGLSADSGTLELGDHPVAEQLRQLDVSNRTRLTKNYLIRYGILPVGELVGPTIREYSGRIGIDREYGQLTVSNDGRAVDVYAGLRSPSG